MKLRWSNGNNYAIEFEANDPESFFHEALSALRIFRTARARRVHRGEIHKTVMWYESCHLGVYDDDNRQWYFPEGEPVEIETKSFGHLSLNRHFDVEAPFSEAVDLADVMHRGLRMTCLDPFGTEPIDLADRYQADRVWNLCIGVWEHGQALHAFTMSVGDAIDKHIEDNEDSHE